MQAFKRDGVRRDIRHDLFVFSKLGLQSLLTILISGYFLVETNKVNKLNAENSFDQYNVCCDNLLKLGSCQSQSTVLKPLFW